jgi:D-xylose transport system ATP-binding protein
MNTPLFEMRGICKRYGGVQALNNAQLQAYPGEIHALVGDNAAGKSTLIKILSGAVAMDEGSIDCNGARVDIRTPREAKRLGIETVYQDLALCDNLDVPSNIFIGRELVKFGPNSPVLDISRMEKEATGLLSRLKINMPNIRQLVSGMSGGQRQCVAIARSVYFDAKLVILDEPTAALGVQETAKVNALVREMRDQGLSVILISHNLKHVFDLTDRITVLKTGHFVGSKRTVDTTQEEILRMIVTGSISAEVVPV